MTAKETHRNDNQGYGPPPEVFNYGDDVTEEAVRYVQAKAETSIKSGNWKVIEGHKTVK